ncbi:MAG: 50S ribosomal protein L31 [Candidatus Paceibacterota bacterium]|jgi:large subunit ribosomal protein L31
MKKDIHPKYFEKAKIRCACGAIYEVGSTIETMEVEICSACHPFYTGKERSSDKVGRVQKFKERLSKKSEKPVKAPRAKKQK